MIIKSSEKNYKFLKVKYQNRLFLNGKDLENRYSHEKYRESKKDVKSNNMNK